MQVTINAKKLAWGGYVVLSGLFIIYSLFVSFRDGMLRNAYQTGSADTVKTLIEKTTDGKCEAVNIYAGEKKVDLIDVSCLKKAADAAVPSAAPALPPPVPAKK